MGNNIEEVVVDCEEEEDNDGENDGGNDLGIIENQINENNLLSSEDDKNEDNF